MELSNLKQLEKSLMVEVARRRSLGGYSTDAEGILIIADALLGVVRHLVDTYQPPVDTLAEQLAFEKGLSGKKAAKKKTK